LNSFCPLNDVVGENLTFNLLCHERHIHLKVLNHLTSHLKLQAMMKKLTRV